MKDNNKHIFLVTRQDDDNERREAAEVMLAACGSMERAVKLVNDTLKQERKMIRKHFEDLRETLREEYNDAIGEITQCAMDEQKDVLLKLKCISREIEATHELALLSVDVEKDIEAGIMSVTMENDHLTWKCKMTIKTIQTLY